GGGSVAMPGFAIARRGVAGIAASGPQWRVGLFGGGLQVVSYGIAVWAMTVPPIVNVAAWREPTVLFGTLIAIVILKEPLYATRAVAAVLIVAGLVALRVG